MAALACALWLLPQAGMSQEAAWPSRPVKLVVPYAPGGGVDQAARIMAERLGAAFGQQFIVENRAGASTIIAADAVAKAAPDGYTLLTPAPATLTVNPNLYAKLPYKVSDFVPVAMFGRIPLFVMVGVESKARNMNDLIAIGNRQDLSYASAGNGSMTHLGTELIKAQTGTKFQHIPFKGTAAAMPEVVSGRAEFMLADLAAPRGLIDAGKLRVLATTSASRSALLPSAPSMEEAGLKGVDVATWLGLAAPRGTPAAIVNRLSAEVNRILADPKAQAQLTQAGLEPMPMGPAAFDKFITDESAKWKTVIHAANIQPD